MYLEDQASLAKLATRSPILDIRLAAIKKLSDKAALDGVIANSEGGRIEACAIQRLQQLNLPYPAMRDAEGDFLLKSDSCRSSLDPQP